MRQSAALFFLTFASFLLGFWRDVQIAGSFGRSVVCDAIFLALVVPVFVENILGIALRDALIPHLRALLKTRTYDLQVNQLGRMVLIAAIFVTFIFCAIPTFWISALAPGWSGEQAALARQMFLIGALSIGVLIWSYFQAGLLSAEGRLILPGWRSVLFNVGAIGAIYLFPGSGTAVLLGIIAGQVFHLIWMQSAIRWRGLGRGTNGLRSMSRFLRGFIPLLLASVALQIIVVAERIFASWLEPGSIAALSYAFRMTSAPVILFSFSIIAVLFPALVTQGLETNIGHLPDLLSKGVRLALLCLIPAAVFLSVCSEPVVRIFFERGAFTTYDTSITAQASIAYALGAPAMGLSILGSRAAQALGMNQPLLVAALAAMAVTISLDAILLKPFAATGLALSLAAGANVQAGALWYAVLRRCKVTGISLTLLRWSVSGIVAGGILFFGTWQGWSGVVACGVASVILSWGLAWIMGERFSLNLLRFQEPD